MTDKTKSERRKEKKNTRFSTRSLETQEKVLVKDETLECVKEKKDMEARTGYWTVAKNGFRDLVYKQTCLILMGVIQVEDETDLRTTTEYAKTWSWHMEEP